MVLSLPSHEDRTPSLSVTQKNGKLLVYCHAGCDQDAVIGELRRLGLWPDKGQPENLGPIVATYDYVDEHGVLRYQVTKHLEPTKDFRQRRPDGQGGWINNIRGVARLPYRLPELLDADSHGVVFIPEGEKDVDNVRKLGLTATCNSMGAGNWPAAIPHWLKGRDVSRRRVYRQPQGVLPEPQGTRLRRDPYRGRHPLQGHRHRTTAARTTAARWVALLTFGQ
jgi:hypothetical protein